MARAVEEADQLLYDGLAQYWAQFWNKVDALNMKKIMSFGPIALVFVGTLFAT